MAMLVIHKHVHHTLCGKLLSKRNSSFSPNTPIPFPLGKSCNLYAIQASYLPRGDNTTETCCASNSHPDLPEAKGMKRATAMLRLMAYAICPWISIQVLFVHPDTEAKHQLGTLLFIPPHLSPFLKKTQNSPSTRHLASRDQFRQSRRTQMNWQT